MKHDKGIAAMDIFVSVIVSLFLLGILIGVFVIINVEFQNSAYDSTTTSVSNEQVTATTTGTDLAGETARNSVCTVSSVVNQSAGIPISVGNYTLSNRDCTIANTTASYPNVWNVTYDYVHDTDNVGSSMINDTSIALASAVDWFPIIIVIAAVVVVLGLLVYVIVSVKRSGMTGSGSSDSGIGGA